MIESAGAVEGQFPAGVIFAQGVPGCPAGAHPGHALVAGLPGRFRLPELSLEFLFPGFDHIDDFGILNYGLQVVIVTFYNRTSVVKAVVGLFGRAALARTNLVLQKLACRSIS